MSEGSQKQDRQLHARWYDEYYQKTQVGLSPWYRFLLPELMRTLRPDNKLIELGCGQGHILRAIAETGLLQQQNITGVDQSKVAVDFCAEKLPKANFQVGDLYDLGGLPAGAFDVCLLMETIEHLDNPAQPLANVKRLLKPGGLLYLSFPNFLHLPWLMVRILSEKLNRPSWIVLQPVDKIYTVFSVKRLLEAAGFRFLKGIGSNYAPPVIYRLETDPMTRFLNRCGFWRLSFHPILVFANSSAQ